MGQHPPSFLSSPAWAEPRPSSPPSLGRLSLLSLSPRTGRATAQLPLSPRPPSSSADCLAPPGSPVSSLSSPSPRRNLPPEISGELPCSGPARQGAAAALQSRRLHLGFSPVAATPRTPNPSRQSRSPPPRAPGRRRPASSLVAAVVQASGTHPGVVRTLPRPSFPSISPLRGRTRSPASPSRAPPSPGRYGHRLRPLLPQLSSPCPRLSPRPDLVAHRPRNRSVACPPASLRRLRRA
jgi:hypothetical protein